MKNQIKVFVLILMIGFVGLNTSCSDDDPVAPVITYPDTGVTPQLSFNEQLNFEFTVVADGGYESHVITTAGGVAIVNSSTPGEGTKEFKISGTYTAGEVAGPGAITLLVDDQKGLSATVTIALVIIN